MKSQSKPWRHYCAYCNTYSEYPKCGCGKRTWRIPGREELK